MSLDLPQLLPQVEDMSKTVAERARENARKLSQAFGALQDAASLSLEALQAKCALAGERWSGAKPIHEAIDARFPTPALPERFAVLGADGSQIYPDRHASVLYYLINIGSILIEHGAGSTPHTTRQPRLYFRDEDLFTEDGSLTPSELINGKRDEAELGELADLAQERPPGEPKLALLDNGLTLWLALQVQDQHQREADRILEGYLDHMDRLRSAGASIAGVIDRPRHANVLTLIHLAQLTETSINEDALRASPYRGLSDRMLFARLLKPGERSACFGYASPVVREFERRGHGVRFFYLNSAEGGQLLRVEVPDWVADRPEALDLVHAGVMEQCRSTGGFPYALIRAHELAVVRQAERQSLEGMLSNALVKHGLIARPSQKSHTKRWTGGRRRHRV